MKFTVNENGLYMYDLIIDTVFLYNQLYENGPIKMTILDDVPDLKFYNLREFSRFLLENPKFLPNIFYPYRIRCARGQYDTYVIKYTISYEGEQFILCDPMYSYIDVENNFNWPTDLAEDLSDIHLECV